MAAFFKFHQFIEALAKKEHNLDTDTLKVYLTNVAPDAALDSVKADLAEIGAGGGYAAGGIAVTSQDAEQVAGVLKLVGDDVTFVAAGGSIGPFRYAVLYNDTHATDGLIGAWDYGSAITLSDGESLKVDFDGANGVLQIT
jgi:hypothetical protein